MRRSSRSNPFSNPIAWKMAVLKNFSATDPQRDRQSRGIGEHELVVSFVSNRPIIVSESSRVLDRGVFQGR